MSATCSVCIVRVQCDDYDFVPCSPACFRAALSAREQRVREEESRNVIGSVSLAAIGEANMQQYQLGYSEALDAAREAVEALDIGRDVRCSVDVKADALAAIDAIREKP